MTGGRVCPPGPQRCKRWPCPSPAAAHSRASLAPHLSSTLALILLMGVQVGQACEHESSMAAPAPSFMCHGFTRVGKICPHPPHTPFATCDRWESQPWERENRRAGPALTRCDNPESKPCSSPGPNSRAGPGDVSAGELDPRV